ncbi:MAG: hypothetical protein B7Z20_10650, partial [Sphingobium sp. 32-64-5]
MNDMASNFSLAVAQGLDHIPDREAALPPMGIIFQISGKSSQVLIPLDTIEEMGRHPDPCVAMAGQVGSQVKINM